MAKRAPTAAELLNGRAHPAADAILRCIQEENPTDRGLPRRETERRYALKARLQSLLIKHHGPSLSIERDERDERVILLRHRVGEEAATHAMIDSLDEDARAFVRGVLDRGEREPDVAPPETTGGSKSKRGTVLDGVSEARAAIEEYDLERARVILDALLVDDSDDVEAAALLTELLVDHLALDDEALALELGKVAQRDLRVRSRLAIATARVALADGRDADAARAIEGVDAALVADSLAPLREEIAKRRLALRNEAEARLQLAVRSVGPADALAAARALLASFPESEVARRVGRDAEREIGRALSDAAVARADRAVASNDLDRAAVCLREALPNAQDRALLEARLTSVERDIAARDRSVRTTNAIAQISRSCNEAAIATYLALDDAARDGVRRELALQVLDWAETLRIRGSAVKTVATAVVALARAMGDARAAHEILPYASVLADVPEAQRLYAQLEQEKRDERTRRARTMLEDARSAVREGRNDDAAKRLGVIRTSDLSSDEVADRAALLAGIEHRRQRDRLVATYHATVESKPFAAQEALALLVARHRGDPTLSLDEWCGRTDERIARSFRFTFERTAIPLADVPWLVEAEGGEDAARLVAEIDGRPHLLIAHVHGMFLCVFIVDADREVIVTRMSLRAWGQMTSADCVWDGTTLRMLSRAGALTVDTASGRVVGWTGFEGDPATLRMDDALLAHDGVYAWLHGGQAGHAPAFDIVNLENERGVRRLAGWSARTIPGVPPRVQVHGENGTTIYDARGQVLDRWDGTSFDALVRMPSGNAWVHSRGSLEGTAGEIELWIRRDDGGLVRAVGVPGTDRSRRHCLFTAGDRVVLLCRDEERTRLLYFREEGDGLVLDDESPVPREVDVSTDECARRAFSVWSTLEGPRIVNLERPQVLPSEAGTLALPQLRWISCGRAPPFELAEQALADGDSAACHSALDALSSLVIGEDQRAHAFHLRALAALIEGDDERALRAVTDGAAIDVGMCRFDSLLEYLERRDTDSDVAAFLRAVADADAALDAGDPHRALTALDVRVVHWAQELQSQARLAATWLELGDTANPPEFAQYHALVAFIASHGDPYANEALIPRRKWSAAKLKELAKRALDWLAVGDPSYRSQPDA